MRVFRVLVGMVLLTVAAPALLAGAIAWYAMQHRDAAGEFQAGLESVAHPGYAVVVPDVDALLRRDAPFARAGRTSMRITAFAGTPLFVGLASPADVAALLQGSPYTSLDGVTVGSRGPLDVSSRAFTGTRMAPLGRVEEQPMWLRSGLGSVEYQPSEWRGRTVALVVVAPDGRSLSDVSLGAAVRFGWLDSTTWGLLILGPVLLLLGFVTLAWPARQVVYVLAPGDPGISLRSGEPVSWTDAPTRESPVILPRPGSVYTSATSPSSPDSSSPDSSAPASPPASSALGSSELAFSSAFSSDSSASSSPEDWARPPAGPASPSTASESGAASASAVGADAALGSAVGSGSVTGSGSAVEDPPSAEWPPPEEQRRTPPPIDVPTQEMRVLEDLPNVPLVLSGSRSSSADSTPVAR